MKKQQRELICIKGRDVALVEVEEKYFPYIIEWRNNPANNAFLNHSSQLTIESQRAWYETYKNDDTQGLLVMLDKKRDNTPFGTYGWTDYDPVCRVCITGRLLIGDVCYRSSAEFLETVLLYTDYIYNTMDVDLCFAHIAKTNISSMRVNKRIGFHSSEGYPKYQFRHVPVVEGLDIVELVRSREDWEKVRAELLEILDMYRIREDG